jgi:hypothetical protein
MCGRSLFPETGVCALRAVAEGWGPAHKEALCG